MTEVEIQETFINMRDLILTLKQIVQDNEELLDNAMQRIELLEAEEVGVLQ